MKFLLKVLLLSLALILCNCETVTKVWTKLSGTSTDEGGVGVAVDKVSRNVYVTGQTKGDLDGQINASYGTYDIFLIKYSADGDKLWTRLAGTFGDDYPSGILVDNNGNCFITGRTHGNLDGQINAGGTDVFVMMYTPTGEKMWTRLSGTPSNEVVSGIAIDNLNNLYISGSTWGNLDGETNAGDADAFVIKYSYTGTKIWTRLVGSSATQYGGGISIDSNNDIYLTGETQESLDGQLFAGGPSDIFVVKFSAVGNKLWTRLVGSESFDTGTALSVGIDGSVYVTGFTSGNLDGQSNAGSHDIFLMKMSTSGTKIWTRLSGSSGEDRSFGISVDTSGNIYLTGDTYGSLDGETYFGITDIFVMKYSSDGTKISTKQSGTMSVDGGYGISVDTSGNAYITGNTYGNLDGELHAGGVSDTFVMKYFYEGTTLLLFYYYDYYCYYYFYYYYNYYYYHYY